MTSHDGDLPGQVRNSVLVGLDGYLFLFDGGQRQFAFLTGECKPSAVEVGYFFDNIATRKAYCDARDIAYLHIVFPSKPVIMKEAIPAPWRDKVESLFLGRYAATLAGGLPDHVLYPQALLAGLKPEAGVFRRLDTHMTDFGALSMARHVLDKLGIRYDPDECFFEAPSELPGDLARMLELPTTEPVRSIRSIVPPLVLDNRQALPGNTNNVVIVHNPCASSDRRLLVFGDSFVMQLLAFMAPAFRDIVYVRSATFQPDMVELCGPDVVLSGNAERYLAKVESDRQSRPMLFAGYGDAGYDPAESFASAYKAQFSWRHHRAQYDAWRRKIDADHFAMGELGPCRPNAQIEVLDRDAGSFKSTGNDPHFVFPKADIVTGRRYLLEFDLVSDVSSTAAVYFTDTTSGRSFGESRTARAPVAVGRNRLRFALDSSHLERLLRIDPLTCPGKFRMANISLAESASPIGP